jgi:hypothetical protein
MNMASTARVTVCRFLSSTRQARHAAITGSSGLVNNVNWGEADNLESLWESLRDLAGRETNKADESDDAQPVSKTLFVLYRKT